MSKQLKRTILYRGDPAWILATLEKSLVNSEHPIINLGRNTITLLEQGTLEDDVKEDEER